MVSDESGIEGEGMTDAELRDQFALVAMQTLSSWNFTQNKANRDEIATRSYSIADSMMEARKWTDTTEVKP